VSTAQKNLELEAHEVRPLEGIYRHYYFDFRDYAFPFFGGGLRTAPAGSRSAAYPAFRKKVLHNPACMEHLPHSFWRA